jgi:hypothetical protein
MAAKKSRYASARPFVATPDGRIPFRGYRARRIGPATGVLEHIVTADDRPDLMALNYYIDDRRWWRILDANAEVSFGGDLTYRFDLSTTSDADELEALKRRELLGETLLIPRASEPGDGE